MNGLQVRITTSIVVAFCGWSVALANPSGTSPSVGLQTHGTIEKAKALAADLSKRLDAMELEVAEMYEIKETPEKFSAKALASLVGGLWKMDRDADHLILMGEPAGYNLKKRIVILSTEVNKLGGAYRFTIEGRKIRAKLQVKLGRGVPKLQRFLASAEKALTDGKLEPFEIQMEKVGTELTADLMYFLHTETPKYKLNFFSLLASGDAKLREVRRKQYAVRAIEAAEKQSAPAMSFVFNADQVITSLNETGTATWDNGNGESVSGDALDAMGHLIDRWTSASAGLIRAHAIDVTFDVGRADEREAACAELKTQATNSLTKLMDAATAKASPDDVPRLYHGFIESIVHVSLRMGVLGKKFRESFDDPLARLMAKKPGFADQIAAYQNATVEPLAWRMEMTKQQQKRMTDGVTPTQMLMSQKVPLTSTIRPKYNQPGTAPREAAGISLAEPSAWIVHEAAVAMVGKTVMETEVLRLAPGGAIGMTPMQGSHYAIVKMPSWSVSQGEASPLLTVVLSDAVYRPLSMDAVEAVLAADGGDRKTTVGVVRGVTMESLAVRLITLPDAAYALVPLGMVGSIDKSTISTAIVWRFDIEPTKTSSSYSVASLAFAPE